MSDTRTETTRPAGLPLDDVNEENGTVYILPYSHIGSRDVLLHKHDPVTNDMVGYFGDLPEFRSLSRRAASPFSAATFFTAAARTRPKECAVFS